MQKIITCLWFDGQAEEAARFYTSIFPDSRITEVLRHGEAGPGEPGTVLTVTFELAGQEFLGLNGGPEFTFSEAISLHVDCTSQDEVDRMTTRLTAGGEQGPCGWVKDRYGLSWQVVPRELTDMLHDPDPVRSDRVMRQMLTMHKLDLEPLRRAYLAE
ncbi:VOC family protein [Saccharopolyspora sp. NPDC047091]|uniref:VOC family protein n=1 Tax=Saccharopolyspora sp. NPDC047091 TaxID=3155924 RepID=UPI0033D2511F